MPRHSHGKVRAIVRARTINADRSPVPAQPNASCETCGKTLHAKVALLITIRDGKLDCTCGGTFRANEARRAMR